MNETAVSKPTEENAMFTSHFQVSKKLFLRYAKSPACNAPCPGTIILLPDWGSPAESHDDIIRALNNRGFQVVSYDWYARGHPQPGGKDNGLFSRHFNQGNLGIFFHDVVLPDFPAPFYILATGAGGLFALAAHDILRNQVYRMLLVSPVLEVQGRRANTLYHQYMRLRSLISLGKGFTGPDMGTSSPSPAKEAVKRGKPAPHWYKMVLNAAAYVTSPAYCERMALPTLFIISTQDRISNPRLTREFAKQLRMAESITIHGAPHDILDACDHYRNQFWKAFDTFIPGSGASAFSHQLENSVIL